MFFFLLLAGSVNNANGGGCNCGTSDGVDYVDEGYLTDKTVFPIREINFGDTDDSSEYLYYDLGPLECILSDSKHA